MVHPEIQTGLRSLMEIQASFYDRHESLKARENNRIDKYTQFAAAIMRLKYSDPATWASVESSHGKELLDKGFHRSRNTFINTSYVETISDILGDITDIIDSLEINGEDEYRAIVNELLELKKKYLK
ncbi:MAG: hypothetical protein NT080_12055 [Spirochaetes bacterium]|nr:hypothetical protein [Spirochaetota bacterium]